MKSQSLAYSIWKINSLYSLIFNNKLFLHITSIFLKGSFYRFFNAAFYVLALYLVSKFISLCINIKKHLEIREIEIQSQRNSIKDLIAKMVDLKRQLEQSQVNIERKLIIDKKKSLGIMNLKGENREVK